MCDFHIIYLSASKISHLDSPILSIFSAFSRVFFTLYTIAFIIHKFYFAINNGVKSANIRSVLYYHHKSLSFYHNGKTQQLWFISTVNFCGGFNCVPLNQERCTKINIRRFWFLFLPFLIISQFKVNNFKQWHDINVKRPVSNNVEIMKVTFSQIFLKFSPEIYWSLIQS